MATRHTARPMLDGAARIAAGEPGKIVSEPKRESLNVESLVDALAVTIAALEEHADELADHPALGAWAESLSGQLLEFQTFITDGLPDVVPGPLDTPRR